MTRLALFFFVLTFLTVLGGALGVAALPIGVVKNLSMIFLILGFITYLGSLAIEKKDRLL